MPKKRKHFIDKNNAVSYRLVPREQCYVQADDNSATHVLVPISKGNKQIEASLPPSVLPAGESVKPIARAFPSKGPRPDWDPDIVAALDDDFNFEDSENDLEDDFVAKANDLSIDTKKKSFITKASVSDDSSVSNTAVDDKSEYSDVESNQFSDVESLDDHPPKSRFTEYSLTSAVSNCSESFKTFNERFEKVLESYDDDQIGSLDLEEITGYLTTDSDRIKQLINSGLSKDNYKLELGVRDESLKQKILRYAAEPKKEKLITIVTKLPTEYDCESILSTYSNKYNHPTVIKAEPRSKKKCVQSELLKQKLTKGHLNQLSKKGDHTDESNNSDEEDDLSFESSVFVRSKDETPEQKRERKRLVKAIKRENRAIKKENKSAFKNEKRRHMSQVINAHRNIGTKLL